MKQSWQVISTALTPAEDKVVCLPSGMTFDEGILSSDGAERTEHQSYI